MSFLLPNQQRQSTEGQLYNTAISTTHPDGRDSNNKSNDVWEHVIRVADECQRVSHVTKDEFDEEKWECEWQHRHQATCLCLVPHHVDVSRTRKHSSTTDNPQTWKEQLISACYQSLLDWPEKISDSYCYWQTRSIGSLKEYIQCDTKRWIILWRLHFSNKRVLLSVLDFQGEAIQLLMFLLWCNRVHTKP